MLHSRAARVALASFSAFTVALGAVACSDLTTEAAADGDVFDAALPGLTPDELTAFVRGDGEFERRFSPASGLGPIFNNVSCASCRSGDGRGRIDNALQRIGSVDDDMLRSIGGPQIQDKAIPGAEGERVPAGVAVSLRLPPPVFGVGLIDAISDATLIALADPDDRDGDGISGRPNWVAPSDYVPNPQVNVTPSSVQSSSLADTKVAPAGRVSVRTTSRASDGPVFCTLTR